MDGKGKEEKMESEEGRGQEEEGESGDGRYHILDLTKLYSV